MKRLSHANTLDVLRNQEKPDYPQTESTNGGKPERKRTQQEQDAADEEARRKAMKDLVGSWNDRLQLISLITTFLASVEAGLLQVSAPDPGSDPSRLLNASNACLISALVIHLHASFISFIAAFFLVRFKVKEAKKEEQKAEASNGRSEKPNKGDTILDMAANHITNSPKASSPPSQPSHSKSHQADPPIWSANPQLVQVGPFFRRQPPINLLSRCHTLCIVCAVLGFVLAMAGIICFAWAQHPRSVSITATASLALCFGSGIAILSTNYDAQHFLYDSE